MLKEKWEIADKKCLSCMILRKTIYIRDKKGKFISIGVICPICFEVELIPLDIENVYKNENSRVLIEGGM